MSRVDTYRFRDFLVRLAKISIATQNLETQRNLSNYGYQAYSDDINAMIKELGEDYPQAMTVLGFMEDSE